MNSSFDSKQRFSSRVENYVKYRPGYPGEIIKFLKEEIIFNSSWIIADIGSGTGLLSKLFLENGNTLYGVEPNFEMRSAAEKQLKQFPNFKSINGNSEDTNLENESADLITAGQAFHWFDADKSKIEFKRILRKDGFVLLIWNNRQTESSPFLKEYEELLKNYSIDYTLVDHKNVDSKILDKFFKKYKLQVFPNRQYFNFEGLKGRLLSSSYAPLPGHSKYEPMMKQLEKIFNKNKENGTVTFKYETELYLGKI